MDNLDSPLDVDRYHFEKHLVGLQWQPQPDIWWDDDYFEIGYEWISKDRTRHAVVTIDGTYGRYRYCYLIGDKFVAGKQFDPLCSEFPDDLREYLNDSVRAART
jgi:hypothetical protein